MNAGDASQSADMSPLDGRKGTPECEEGSEKGAPLDFILVTSIPQKPTDSNGSFRSSRFCLPAQCCSAPGFILCAQHGAG
ncbi:hypothetical protein CEXT_490331 [Caerostris extrusa]|uniref:Uncharacterized protein n=1 Tax=Caerostris extrusa TaxID=172846 RepID=A0AAV4PP87_CAEEX|nr:hypothetical protein CEXT_490331 [Caerostris extrusa]